MLFQLELLVIDDLHDRCLLQLFHPVVPCCMQCKAVQHQLGGVASTTKCKVYLKQGCLLALAGQLVLVLCLNLVLVLDQHALSNATVQAA